MKTPPPDTGLILCVDSAEARLLRKQGYTCLTSAKIRNALGRALDYDCDSEAAMIVERLNGISTADDPGRWPMWENCFAHHALAQELRDRLLDLPPIPTPFRDPEHPRVYRTPLTWPCEGTTVLVAKDTFELVRVAETYAKYDCYRPKGRMDEPFTPQQGRVCLISIDELRLIRIEGLEDVDIVLTFAPQEVTGMVETPYPSSLRALCAERPQLSVGICDTLAPPRIGQPFFLGLTRGVGHEGKGKTAADGVAARAYCYETNLQPKARTFTVVLWAGGNDLHQLLRYGGLSIITGYNQRRKVQLRSLRLIKAGERAGASIYDLVDNYDKIFAWTVKGTFERVDTCQRAANSRRVRLKKTSRKYPRGYIYNNNNPPRVLKRRRNSTYRLRNYEVVEVKKGGGVSTVRLKNLEECCTYYLNGKARHKDGDILVEPKRCMIRCVKFDAWDNGELLEHLEDDNCVIMAGIACSGKVFSLVKVANGTEDQQRMAVMRWAEPLGASFPTLDGVPSWIPESIAPEDTTAIAHTFFTNWKADALETAQYERYITTGAYRKAVKPRACGGTALSQRVRLYVKAVEGLSEEGGRNARFSSVLLNMRDLFGVEEARKGLSILMSKCTLPQREMIDCASRILNENKEEGE